MVIFWSSISVIVTIIIAYFGYIEVRKDFLRDIIIKGLLRDLEEFRDELYICYKYLNDDKLNDKEQVIPYKIYTPASEDESKGYDGIIYIYCYKHNPIIKEVWPKMPEPLETYKLRKKEIMFNLKLANISNCSQFIDELFKGDYYDELNSHQLDNTLYLNIAGKMNCYLTILIDKIKYSRYQILIEGDKTGRKETVSYIKWSELPSSYECIKISYTIP